MKAAALFVLGGLSTAALCNVANARGITVNSWGQAPSGTYTILPSSTSEATPDLSVIGISTPIDLSFTPGVTSAPIYEATPGPGDMVEYAWGGDTYMHGGPVSAQVVLKSSSATAFELSIGYTDINQSDPHAASVSIDGITYSASLTSDNPEANVDNFLDIGFVGGTWKVTGESDNDWKESGGPSSAPEIDPTSAMSALTLLAGAIAVLRGWAPRRRQAGARA